MHKINIAALLEPDLQATQHCQKLQQLIKREIQIKNTIPFDRFMELALYAPDLGYYMSSLPKLGKTGDFITAPEYSSLFSQALAKQCAQIINATSGAILELGAGSGRMALELLKRLEQLDHLPSYYYILEISKNLRQRQEQLLRSQLPHLAKKIIWLESLPLFPFNGLIIANEVMDAFPVHLFKFQNNHFLEFYVKIDENSFSWQLDKPQPPVLKYLESLPFCLSEGYISECNLLIAEWIKKLSDVLNQGAILLLDYGFPQHEYYHPDRHMGTLMCHYQHQIHNDPLAFVGLQDITSHINFTQVAEEGYFCGLHLAGYTNQASFLLSCGIIDDLKETRLQQNYHQLANQLKVLTSPNEMGELFKVMAFTKQYHEPLLGFSLRNSIERL